MTKYRIAKRQLDPIKAKELSKIIGHLVDSRYLIQYYYPYGYSPNWIKLETDLMDNNFYTLEEAIDGLHEFKRQQEIKKVKEAVELLDRNKSYYEMEF